MSLLHLLSVWQWVCGDQGNLDVATQLLIEACDLFPDDFSLLQTLGTLQVRCAFALGCVR